MNSFFASVTAAESNQTFFRSERVNTVRLCSPRLSEKSKSSLICRTKQLLSPLPKSITLKGVSFFSLIGISSEMMGSPAPSPLS